MDICFVYLLPHPSHKGFAESINARFCYYHTKFKNLKLPRAVKSILGGLTLPKADVYLCEGGAPLLPVYIKKKINKNTINIELVADETFMVLESTSRELRKNYPWYVNKIHEIVMQEIDGAIAVSKMAKDSIKRYLDVPVKVVHPYIEDEVYYKLSSIYPNLNSNVIVSVGYAKPSKGMDILVKAFELVKKDVSDAELYIIGKGHPKEWEKIDGVHVLGYVSDFTPYFKKACLFVQSSRFDTFPVATLESLRAGLPTIVTEKTGTKEVIIKLGKNFIRKVNAEDIAEGILTYYDLSASKREKLSRKAKKISVKFNKQEMCRKFRQEFWELINYLT